MSSLLRKIIKVVFQYADSRFLKSSTMLRMLYQNCRVPMLLRSISHLFNFFYR